MASNKTIKHFGSKILMVTLREISAAVGVSPATVSRVLNFNATLSVLAQVRRAIIETAEAMNYETLRNRSRTPNWRCVGGMMPIGIFSLWMF